MDDTQGLTSPRLRGEVKATFCTPPTIKIPHNRSPFRSRKAEREIQRWEIGSRPRKPKTSPDADKSEKPELWIPGSALRPRNDDVLGGLRAITVANSWLKPLPNFRLSIKLSRSWNPPRQAFCRRTGTMPPTVASRILQRHWFTPVDGMGSGSEHCLSGMTKLLGLGDDRKHLGYQIGRQLSSLTPT